MKIIYNSIQSKITDNILAQFFHYLLFYMKPDTDIIISGITDLPL